MANVNSKLIDQIKTKADDAMDNGDDKQKQIGAIIKIISHTGLRIGSRAAFQKTKNRGVCTLNPENVKIDKNDIYFSFVGKSYKNNTSHINDAKLAKVLLDLKEKNSGENFLFNHDRVSVDRMFKNTFGFKKLKLKDMRTYIATSLAKDVLYEDKSFGKKLTGNDKENKKLIQGHLQKCYGIVSKKLNNTPIMARDSYIHPAVVQDWLIQLGANVDEFMKSMEINSLVLATPTLDQIIKRSKFKGSDSVVIDEEDEENCDEFPLQPWEV
jgi:DNA topoisomerase-1